MIIHPSIAKHILQTPQAQSRPKFTKRACLSQPTPTQKNIQQVTRHKNKAGLAFSVIGKLKNINRLRADNFVGFTPTQFLWRDRCQQ